MLSLSKKAFEDLVEEALADIPKEFRDLARNVQITVQSRPGPEAGRMPDPELLLGLYLGPSLKDTAGGVHPSFPARIVLYQAPLQEGCHDEATLKRQVALTLRHEFAHHLGFSDEELQERWPEGA